MLSPSLTLDVRQFGARGDGRTSDHQAFLTAIEAIAKQRGGTLRVPPGDYRIGSLRLCSGLTLQLDADARLRALDDPELFPVLAETANRPGVIRALIWADNASDIAIEGKGAIDGGGNSALTGADAAAQRFRPALMYIRNCQRLRFAGISLLHSQFWTLHLLRCRDVTIDGLFVRTHPARINADGIDPDGCENVRISRCDIWTGDDAIVLKSTEGDACHQVEVSDCRLRSSCAALKLGTESIGTISDVRFRNCTIDESAVALALYMKDGGAYEQILFEDMRIEANGPFPLIVDITPRKPDQPKVGRIRDVQFRQIVIKGRGRALIEGRANSPIEKIRMTDLIWQLPEPTPPPKDGKPRGAARVVIDQDAVDYSVGTGQFIVAHARDVVLTRVRVEGAGNLRTPVDLHHSVDCTTDVTVE